MQGGTTYSTQTYNAFGLRVETSYPQTSATVDSLFDPAGSELGHYNAAGSAWYDRDISLAGPGSRMIAQAQPSDTYFLHANALDSDTQLTSHTGSVLMDSLFYPLGQVWKPSGTLPDVHFAGLEQRPPQYNYDTTPNRAYANTHGHWLSPDPLAGDVTNPQSLNRYAYVLNNPTTVTDPTGLQPPGCPEGMPTNECYGGIPGFWAGGIAPGTIEGGMDEFDWLEMGYLPNPADPCSSPLYAEANPECATLPGLPGWGGWGGGGGYLPGRLATLPSPAGRVRQ